MSPGVTLMAPLCMHNTFQVTSPEVFQQIQLNHCHGGCKSIFLLRKGCEMKQHRGAMWHCPGQEWEGGYTTGAQCALCRDTSPQGHGRPHARSMCFQESWFNDLRNSSALLGTLSGVDTSCVINKLSQEGVRPCSRQHTPSSHCHLVLPRQL